MGLADGSWTAGWKMLVLAVVVDDAADADLVEPMPVLDT